MKITGKIIKANFDEKKVFGWASVAADENGAIVDSDGDIIKIDELETAAYGFVVYSRTGGEMHEKTGIGVLIESMVFTPEKIAALNLPENSLPLGWWVGFQIFDEAVWQKIKSGEYSMFSIGGEATREAVSNE